MEEKLTQEQIEVRNMAYFDLWQKYKSRWTMKQIATMLNCPLSTFYQIIREQKERLIKKRSEKQS